MHDHISGFAWLLPDDDPGSLPAAWREHLASQTLPEVASDDPHALLLTAEGLPDAVPAPLDRTLLERMAWALLARPHCDVLFYPLSVSLAARQPGTILPCAPEELELALSRGFLAIAHRRVGAAAPAYAAAPDRRSALRGSAVTAEVFSRALLDEQLALLPRAARGERSTGSLVQRLKARLPHRLRAWLKRGYLRVRTLIEPESAPDGQPQDSTPLALETSWLPPFPTPQMDVRVPAVGDRVPVWLALHWLELGGAEKFAIDLIQALPRDRYAVYVTTDLPSENPWAAAIRENVEEILHFPEFLPGYMIGVFGEHFVRTRGLRLLHLHHAPRVYETLFHLRRFHPALRVLHSLHILELPPNSGGYPEWSMRHFGVFIDHHHVISRQLEQFLVERWRVPTERIAVVRIGVDVEHFDPDGVPPGIVRRWLGIRDDALLVGFVGRFTRQKRPLEFVDLARLLHDQWRLQGREVPLQFVMAGGGELRAEVERAIRLAGLGGIVHVLGELTDTRPVYKDCDVIAMPSENEGLALVTYEAMAMATPVFFTNVGAQSELLGPEQLVDRRAPVSPALADRLWPVLVDAERRRTLGAAARARVLREYRLSDSLDRVIALYERLVPGAVPTALQAGTAAAPAPRTDVASSPADTARRPGGQHRRDARSVAVAVVSYNHRDPLLRLLELLDRRGIPTFVTENASSDGTREAVAGRFTHVSVLESPANLGGCGGFNCAVLAALSAGTEYVLLIDDDALPVDDCIERLAGFLDDHPGYVFAAPAVYIASRPDTLQEAGGGIDFTSDCPVQAWHRFAVDPELPPHIDIDYASACCLMVRADAVLRLGVMDWNYFIFSDDVDWSIRLQRAFGKGAACVPGARALHDFPWAKPFSPMRLYFFQRNGLYLLARLREGAASAGVVRATVTRLVRRMLYAACIGDRETARTLWDALRDAWRGRFGAWETPVAFPTHRRRLDAAVVARRGIRRVLVDVSIEDFDASMLEAIRQLGGADVTVDVLCDRHRVDPYRAKALFAEVHGRSEGTFGALKDFWYARRRGYDLSVTDAFMEPRRPASMSGRRAAFFHADTLYEAASRGWLSCAAHVAAPLVARAVAAPLHRRFLVPPPAGRPPVDAKPVLEHIGVAPAVGQPWARDWRVPLPVPHVEEAAVLRVAGPDALPAGGPAWTPLPTGTGDDRAQADDDYTAWCVARRRCAAARYAAVSRAPSFSIIVDARDAAPQWLDDCLHAVHAQVQPACEVLVIEAQPGERASGAAGVTTVLEASPADDPFAIARRGAQRASGEYLVFLDAADVLDPHALVAFADAASRDATTDVLYADEDRIDGAGRRCLPQFKPDYAPAWVAAWNYLGRPVAVRRSLVADLAPEAASPRSDEAFVRRAAAAARRVAHVPDVLCHRRLRPGEEEATALRKDRTRRAPRPTATGTLRISVLVLPDGPTSDAELQTVWADCECLVAPADETPAARRLNALLERARGDVVLTASSELRPAGGWRDALSSALRAGDVGLVGGRVRYADGRLHSAGLTLGTAGAVGRWHHGASADAPGVCGWIAAPHEVSAVPWQFLAIRRDLLLREGRFDPAFAHGGFDTDLALRLATRLGVRHLYVPDTGGTFVPGHPEMPLEPWSLDDLTLLWERWGRLMRRGDPYVNPHFSLLTEDVRIVTQEESDLRARGAHVAWDRTTAGLLLARFPDRQVARASRAVPARHLDSSSPSPAAADAG